MLCKNCGTELEKDSLFCKMCGEKVSHNTSSESVGMCKKCGTTLLEGDTFCPMCGTEVGSNESSIVEEPTENKHMTTHLSAKNTDHDNKLSAENSDMNHQTEATGHSVSVCKKCGQPLLEGDLFCAQCGKSITEPEIKAISYPSSNAAGVSAMKQSRKRSVKKYAIIGAVVIVLIALLLIIIHVSDSKRADETENKIQAVKDSMFTFLPEITVGQLLDENYSDGHWIYNTQDMCVEFFGTNNNDQSGLSIQFQVVQSGAVNVRESTYDSKGVTVSMDSKEFEEYIIGLYNNLPDIYADTTETIQTTVSVKTEKATKKEATTTETPAPSIDYSMYYDLLSNGSYYTLFDINQDGVTELLLYIGDGSISDVYVIYSIIGDQIQAIGEINGFSCRLSEKNGKLYSNFGHNGYQLIEEIKYDGYLVTVTTVSEGEVGGNYTAYGNELQEYASSDTDPISELENDSVS